MVEYKPGAENIIPRDKLIIKAFVYSLMENDKIVAERTFDYSDYNDRKALGALSFWAFKNRCSVETMAVTDANGEG